MVQKSLTAMGMLLLACMATTGAGAAQPAAKGYSLTVEVTGAKETTGVVRAALFNDPAAFQKFQAAQGELSRALSRLMVTVERYPELKANAAFQDLRVQLEGTENRITVARNRYIKAVNDFNVLARSFPSNLTAMVMGYKPKANFSVANEAAISAPPKVDFGK